MWLTQRLSPCFKTIAEFRRVHATAIVGVCRSFTRFCRDLDLIGNELLAIDGTKIQAVASRKQVMTPKRIAKMTAAIDAKIADAEIADTEITDAQVTDAKITDYLADMDKTDAVEEAEAESNGKENATLDVKAALAALKDRRAELQALASDFEANKTKQKVMTEPDARLMRTANHGYQVAYNAQSVVDSKHKLIVAFDLVNDGNDQQQLHAMAQQGKQAVAAKTITVVADAGYSSGKQAANCAADGITAIVPRPQIVNPKGKQYFPRDAFSYDKDSDTWTCPAKQTLVLTRTSKTEARYQYQTPACGQCPLKVPCTSAERRTILRHFDDDAREAMHQRAIEDPKWMIQRRSLVEHPFAGIKWLMGHPRFLLRGLKKAKSELALSIMAYNLKRMINILGVTAVLKALSPNPA